MTLKTYLLSLVILKRVGSRTYISGFVCEALTPEYFKAINTE